MIENIDSLTKEIRKVVKKSVSRSRYEHSVRTAKTCRSLCKKYGLDAKTGYFAGLSHDMCKKFSPEELFETAGKDGAVITELEKENPSLLHGRAAAVKLREDFNVKDTEVLQAVANHTFGKKGMCSLAKVLFISDKIEPGREQVDKKYMNSIKNLTLDQLVYKVVSESREYLLKKGKKIAPETEELLEELKREGL